MLRDASEATNPVWGDDWPAVRRHWLLDPDIAYLNHGAFGACPRPVLEAQSEWRKEMETRPVEFLDRRLPRLLEEARARVADFVKADADELAFVPNATTGVNTVLAGIGLGPEDQVIATDHAYPAVKNIIARICAATGAQAVGVEVPLPLPSKDDLVERISGAVTDRTKIVVVDHVASPTAVVFPVREIVEACRAKGALVLVDAAHAPGMLPIDLTELRADFWTGNLHKWVCAPKGAAVLAVRKEHQAALQPLVTSHGYGGTFRARFDWTGTHDPTPYLSIPTALDFLGRLGWDRLWAHNRALVRYGRRVVAEAIDAAEVVRDDAFEAMAIIPVDEGAAANEAEAVALQASLYDDHGVEVPMMFWNGRGYLRISAQVYNRPFDYETLAAALPVALKARAEGKERQWPRTRL